MTALMIALMAQTVQEMRGETEMQGFKTETTKENEERGTRP
jgi:hypothetical protein